MKVNVCFISITLFIFQNTLASKNSMKILAIMAKTGKEPSKGEACLAAMQVAVDICNNRSDILPGYHLEIDDRDESRGGVLNPKQISTFYRDMEGNLSPIVVGPFHGSESASLPAKMFDTVVFPIGGATPTLVEYRHLYSNTYRVMTPATDGLYAMLYFIKNIGQWREMAFVSSLNYRDENKIKLWVQKLAGDMGIKAVSSDSGYKWDMEFTAKVKNGGGRVIYLATIVKTLIVDMLCNAWILGMRAPHYVFLVSIIAFAHPQTPNLEYPDGCNAEILTEQLKITFFPGITLSSPNNFGPSSFGYDAVEFEHMFQQRLATKNPPDYIERYICHDSMMAALITLNRTENRLLQRNMTLRDFRNNTKIVRENVEASAAGLEFMGLRIGKIKFSENQQIEHEPYYMFQFIDGNMNLRFQVKKHENYTKGDIDKYHLKVFSEIQWQTKTGRPPKDLSAIRHIFLDMSFPVFLTLTVICSILALSKLLLLLKVGTSTASKNWKLERIPLTMFCFLLDISAIFSLLETYFHNIPLCIALYTFGLGSFTAVSCWIFFSFAFSLKHFNHPKFPLNDSTIIRFALDAPPPKSHGNKTSFLVIILGCFVMGVTGLLLGHFDMPKTVSISTPIQFDEINDEYVDTTDRYCHFDNQIYLIPIIFAINATLLIASLFFNYTLNHRHVPKDHRRIISKLGMSTRATFTILVGTVLIIIISSNMENRAKSAAIALCLLFFSASGFYVNLKL